MPVLRVLFVPSALESSERNSPMAYPEYGDSVDSKLWKTAYHTSCHAHGSHADDG